MTSVKTWALDWSWMTKTIPSWVEVGQMRTKNTKMTSSLPDTCQPWTKMTMSSEEFHQGKKIRETEFLLFWRIFFLGPEDGPVFHGQVCTKGQPIRLCLGQMMNLRKKQLIKSKHCLKKSIIVSTKMDLTKMAMMTLMRMSVQEHPILLVQSIHVFQKKWRVNVPFGDKGFHIWGKKTRQIENDQLYFTEKSWFF